MDWARELMPSMRKKGCQIPNLAEGVDDLLAERVVAVDFFKQQLKLGGRMVLEVLLVGIGFPNSAPPTSSIDMRASSSSLSVLASRPLISSSSAASRSLACVAVSAICGSICRQPAGQSKGERTRTKIEQKRCRHAKLPTWARIEASS